MQKCHERCLIKVSGYQKQDNVVYCVQERISEILQQRDHDFINGESLGLAIARRIINRHNGKVWVESEQAKGSKFFVALPAG